MRTKALLAVFILLMTGTANAEEARKGALDNTADLFGAVTPDRLLGKTTRRKWLDLYPVDAKIYWAAWDCKDNPCDTTERAHIRTIAKLVPRTSHDPRPIDDISTRSGK